MSSPDNVQPHSIQDSSPEIIPCSSVFILPHLCRGIQRLYCPAGTRHLGVASPARDVVRLWEVKVTPGPEHLAVEQSGQGRDRSIEIGDVANEETLAVLHLHGGELKGEEAKRMFGGSRKSQYHTR